MPLPSHSSEIAEAIRQDIETASSAAKRLKVRTLLRKFGFIKRSDSNTAEITGCLSERGIAIKPPIVRLGDSWELSIDDWIYLSTDDQDADLESDWSRSPLPVPVDWNSDGWFDKLEHMKLRTEKEVEIKFIVPLLRRLGYSDDDRYDGMPVPAAHGSRATTLVIDFALFNSVVEALRNQPLLTVEAKREERLTKAKEIQKAHNQAKSYCLWTQARFEGLIDPSLYGEAEHYRGGAVIAAFGEIPPLEDLM